MYAYSNTATTNPLAVKFCARQPRPGVLVVEDTSKGHKAMLAPPRTHLAHDIETAGAEDLLRRGKEGLGRVDVAVVDPGGQFSR